jgi:hypothetical protein
MFPDPIDQEKQANSQENLDYKYLHTRQFSIFFARLFNSGQRYKKMQNH